MRIAAKRYEVTDFAKGQGVVYQPHPNAHPLDGTVVRVTDQYVFVQYQDGGGPKATYAKDLRPAFEKIGDMWRR